MDLYRALPRIREELEDIDERVRGRLAVVSEATPAGMVLVTLPGGDGAIGPYPTTTPWVQSGAKGILQPLRGNQYVFIGTGAAAFTPVIPISRSSSTRLVTTSIATFESVVSQTLMLSQGQWLVVCTATAGLYRSAATGRVLLRLDVGGTTFENSAAYDALAGGGYIPVSVAASRTITVPPEGADVPITLGYRGGETAASTYIYGAAMSGTATRIG